MFNKASYIRETLDSALQQTYPNTEIVLVDDGSTDGSFEILKEYFAKYPDRIVLIDQENKGVSVATNVGITASSGEYIQFLDADDLMSTDKIENQINMLVGKSPTEIASCEWVNFKENIHQFSRLPYGIFRDFETGLNLLLRFWNHQEMMAICSFLTHRSLIEKAGPWDETLTINQDGEFFVRVLLHSKGVIFEDKGKVFYRIPAVSNVSQQKGEKAATSLLESYRCYERAVLKNEDSKRVRTALKKVYQKFIYDVFPNYPDVIKEAEGYMENLNVSEKTFIGGPKFQLLSKWVGFKNALKLKRSFASFSSRE